MRSKFNKKGNGARALARLERSAFDIRDLYTVRPIVAVCYQWLQSLMN
jgi:hypothetical protein